jgi:hypothetical protein
VEIGEDRQLNPVLIPEINPSSALSRLGETGKLNEVSNPFPLAKISG